LLFLTAGSLFYATDTTELDKLGGISRNMPYTTMMFAVAAAAIAGLPPFNGFVSKLLIYESSFVVHPFLAVVAMVTSILTLASFVKVFQSGFLGPSREELASTREVPLTMIVGMSVLCLMILGLSLMPNWALSNLIEPAARDLVNQASYIQAVMGSGL